MYKNPYTHMFVICQICTRNVFSYVHTYTTAYATVVLENNIGTFVQWTFTVSHLLYKINASKYWSHSDILNKSIKIYTIPSSLWIWYDPQPGVVREQYPRTAMCVRNVDVHVSCSSQVDAQFAAFFIDPRAKWSTVQGNLFLFNTFSK